jgi:superfamily II DNA/RNA helicase
MFRFLCFSLQLNRDESLYRLPTRLARPRALVVVPNRELAVQILSVVKGLSRGSASRGGGAHIRSFASTGFIPLRKLTRALESPIDLLIVTPGRLEFLLASGRIALGDVRYVVCDETDTLLSEVHGFAQTIERVLLKPLRERVKKGKEQLAKNGSTPANSSSPTAIIPSPPPDIQFLFCSASITPAIESYIARAFPGLLRLHTPSLHHLPEGVVLSNILVGNGDKKEMLWNVLRKESENYKRRLMHGRTRAQNLAEIRSLGGNPDRLWMKLVEADAASRGGVPLDHLEAAARQDAAELVRKGQMEYDEAEQNEAGKRRELGEKDEEGDEEQDPEAKMLAASGASHPDRVSAPRLLGDSIPSGSLEPPPTPVYLPLPPTLIFCNTVSCCRAIAWFLTNQGLRVGHYHGLMPLTYRTEHFRNFLSGATNILVCTDLASRGLDTTMVQHVIHFDFPHHSVVDFMHRVGRTARNGSKGKSTALLEKKDRVLAEAIQVSKPAVSLNCALEMTLVLFLT